MKVIQENIKRGKYHFLSDADRSLDDNRAMLRSKVNLFQHDLEQHYGLQRMPQDLRDSLFKKASIDNGLPTPFTLTLLRYNEMVSLLNDFSDSWMKNVIGR